jgi:hypothetical protein
MDQRHNVAVCELEEFSPEPQRPVTRSADRPVKSAEPQPRMVGEARAAALLGVSAQKLRRLHSQTGLGRAEQEGREEVVFTYAELYRLCRSAVMVAD